ncbi:MAG: sugar ABC transporter substrate-binding protein [Dolichospermum sp. OL03]|nr:sugar ABC transporter substrate-binding protein [Dolichospermum sp. OL03]MCS6282335.1 sugar ABC transporter substrate-binding protein [Dolichospermum sp.]
MWKRRQNFNIPILCSLVLIFLILVACISGTKDDNTLDIWVHAGQEAERKTITAQVERYNQSDNDIKLKLTFIPQGSYNSQVQAAALSGDLPDILEFDGPFVYNYVWQKNLIPIDDIISPEVKNDLLPSIIEQGTYDNRLYSIGSFDSGLGLYGNRKQLKTAGIRIPKDNSDAWTVAEFDQILAKLRKQDPNQDGQVLDLKLNYGGEWFTYGFYPIIHSANGSLLKITGDKLQAAGAINSKQAIQAMTHLQSWLQKGYVDPNLDDAAFTSKKVALSWVGHWAYDSYVKALGDDLVLLPLPDFGAGSKTGQGSWNWGITNNCKHPKGAMKFLEFLLQPQEVLAMTNANGAVPATKSAIAISPLYQPGGPLSLFSTQLLNNQAVPRPRTPGYAVVTSAFQKAFNNIRNGVNVKQALTKAAIIIDIDIEDNQGYPQVNS